MSFLLADLLSAAAGQNPAATALIHRQGELTYGELAARVESAAQGFLALGLGRAERIGIYLDKRFETIIAIFAAAAAGCAFVPINPLLKARQVGHILRDCQIRLLVTSADRRRGLVEELDQSPDLRHLVQVDGEAAPAGNHTVTAWDGLLASGRGATHAPHRVIDQDMTAILYTSGSTGMPKGVVLSHRNLVAGAASVSSYLGHRAGDRILSVLPLSFDAGLSQITTAFHAGASVVLLDYLLPQDVVKAIAAHRVTGMTGVPPLWNQLADTEWPEAARQSLRYFANTGGHMPRTTLARLRALLPRAEPFLMYGLTEAFRSTYLPPAEVDRRPDSIGKAIPNAEILLVGDDGRLCGPGEQGELVHRGALVAMGYWNDPVRTAERFRPAPGRDPGLRLPEIAVWSGDTVRMDEEGFLYFVGRRDDMIKTSGYRVSPTEIEEAVYASQNVGEAVAVGVPYDRLGQAIVVVATPPRGGRIDRAAIIAHCRRQLPAFMVPLDVVERAQLPRNANGKIDRKALAQELAVLFLEPAS
jgi:acyl-CoA ligase (AMP-forming) (exosortase A-associated)